MAPISRSENRADWLVYDQFHIDVARNASDDFNPFHDPNKWHRVRNNPFGGPIALGFQIECLLEYLLTRERASQVPAVPVSRFRTYQFAFSDVLYPGERFQPHLKPMRTSRQEQEGTVRSNRIVVRKDTGVVLLGAIRDSEAPFCSVAREGLGQVGVPAATIARTPDRSWIAGTNWFHKRKYMMNANAKNLIAASLGDQGWYFDEIEHRINFPDMVPASLISCALLERADLIGLDFYRDPMVYTAHHISVNQPLARALRSNDTVRIIVDEPSMATRGEGLRGTGIEQHRHRCLCLLDDGQLLFGAEVLLAPLHAIST